MCIAKRVPFADHIIALTSSGKICEQGTFKELSSAGGYISSFNLPPPDWNYYPSFKSLGIDKETTPILALEQVIPPKETADDAARRNGDISVYMYYLKTVGVIPVLIFVFAISAFIFCISFPGMCPRKLIMGLMLI